MSMEPLTITTAIITLSKTLQQVVTLLSDFANADKKVAEIRRDLELTQSVLKYIHEQENKQNSPPTLSIDDDPRPSRRRASNAGVHLSHVLRDNISQLQLDLQCFSEELSKLAKPCSPGSKVGKIVANGKVAWKMSYLERMQQSIVNKRMQLELVRNSLEIDRRDGHASPERRKSADRVASIFHALARHLNDHSSETSLPPPSYHAQEIFVKAVRKGRWRDVEGLLKQVHPNFRLGPKEGEVFPLHIAAMLGDLAMAELLISYGATVDCCAQSNETPLMMAIEHDRSVVALALIRRGADVNRSDSRGQTPLHMAARKNSKAVVQTLLNNGADANSCDAVGNTPLMAAICRDDREIQPSDTSVLRVLLQPNGYTMAADPTLGTERKHYTPLHHAAAQGWLEDLRIMMTLSCSRRAQECAVLDYMDRTPIWFAAKHNRLDVMEHLINSGADVNQLSKDRENPAALWAASHNAATVEVLLCSGCDSNLVNNEGHTLLHRACWTGNVVLARLLLQHEADPTIRDKNGMQPLHYASREGYDTLVKMLLESSKRYAIDINCVDNTGNTPLMFAADQGHDFMIKLLLNHTPPADFRQRDKLGCDAFYFACARGHILCASYLLGCGANINTRNNKDNTPLHVVAKLGRKDMVGWLLRMGADKEAKSTQPFDGMDVKGTPPAIAKAAGLSPSLCDEIVDMLQNWEPDRRREVRYTASRVPF
ncbi:ankyrin repeat-containing domain protein [Triangularia setosa]|uniref:Ankyrin repeat-containing domain protein n=1 Tax=Triangularia setosa TaxID=2587417 RepID=A0AAN6W7M6_9PEZI|nr:ankyrin repeat-containing domain protein [Podospora setosa]